MGRWMFEDFGTMCVWGTLSIWSLWYDEYLKSMVRWMLEVYGTVSVWRLLHDECLKSVVRWVFKVCGTLSVGSLWHDECLKTLARWVFEVCGTLSVEDCGTMSIWSLWHGECLKTLARWVFEDSGTMDICVSRRSVAKTKQNKKLQASFWTLSSWRICKVCTMRNFAVWRTWGPSSCPLRESSCLSALSHPRASFNDLWTSLMLSLTLSTAATSLSLHAHGKEARGLLVHGKTHQVPLLPSPPPRPTPSTTTTLQNHFEKISFSTLSVTTVKGSLLLQPPPFFFKLKRVLGRKWKLMHSWVDRDGGKLSKILQ